MFTSETRTQTAKFYADDSLLSVMGNDKNVQAVFQALDELYTFVGLSINYNKTTIVRICSLHHSKAIFYTQKKLSWSDGVFTLLGVQINIHDLHDISCYQKVVKKMYTVLDSWIHQHFTIYGKVPVLNSLLMQVNMLNLSPLIICIWHMRSSYYIICWYLDQDCHQYNGTEQGKSNFFLKTIPNFISIYFQLHSFQVTLHSYISSLGSRVKH